MSGYISKPVDSQIYTVSKMIRSGMNSGYGTPCDYIGLRAALRAGRRWMDRNPDFYFTIERKMNTFSDSRGKYRRGPDVLCLTGNNHGEMAGAGALDAPEYIAAGSVEPFGDGADWEQSIASRGYWL